MSSMEAKQQIETSQSGRRDMDTRRWPDAKAHRIFWSIVIIGTGADLWSKWAVFKWLPGVPGEEYFVIDGLFKLVMALNNGAAFGIAEGKTGVLVAVSVIALVVVLCVFVFGRVHQRVVQVALALFTAGIIGNLFDRVFNDGCVRDFIDVLYWPDKHWPAFNVADSMLCIAIGLLIILTVTGQSGQGRGQQQK